MTINETSIEDAFLRESASRKLLARVSSPCAILVLTALGADAMNYRSLRHKLDRISPKVLTHTLSRLERDGLVLRQSPQATAHYDTSVYTLSNAARSLGARSSDRALCNPGQALSRYSRSKRCGRTPTHTRGACHGFN